MHRTRIAARLLPVAVALVVVGCSGGSKDESAGRDTPAGTPTTVVSETTVITPSTPAPGEVIAPGSIESERQDDLSEPCATALEPIRELMGRIPSGLLIADETDMAANDEGMKAAQAGCSPEEFTRWYELEYVGWNNGETGTQLDR